MLPLNQKEIEEYKQAFQQFSNRLDDDNVLITIEDMAKLLWELSKTHSETDAKTLFNELEIAADGTGWILDLPTFMVLMLQKGTHKRNQNRKNRNKRSKIFTKQWQYLIANGSLTSTETNVAEIGDTLDDLEILREVEMYKYKSYRKSETKCIRYPNYQREYGVEFPSKRCRNNDVSDNSQPRLKVSFEETTNSCYSNHNQNTGTAFKTNSCCFW
eukprot:97784_1